MQEQVSASIRQMSELAAPKNSPTLEDVRDKIERRYSNALGQADLATNSVQGRMLEVKKATASMAGQSRLEEIRASLASSSAAGSGSSPADAIDAEQNPAIEQTKPQGAPGSHLNAVPDAQREQR
jgi:phage shock protein A